MRLKIILRFLPLICSGCFHFFPRFLKRTQPCSELDARASSRMDGALRFLKCGTGAVGSTMNSTIPTSRPSTLIFMEAASISRPVMNAMVGPNACPPALRGYSRRHEWWDRPESLCGIKIPRPSRPAMECATAMRMSDWSFSHSIRPPTLSIDSAANVISRWLPVFQGGLIMATGSHDLVWDGSNYERNG